MTTTRRIASILAAILAITAAGSSRADLIAHYTLDEVTGTAAGDSAPDAVDHGGALINFAFDTGATIGVVGGALQFDGTNDRVRLEGGGATQPTTDALALTSWTLAGHFQKTGDGSGNQDHGGGGLQGMALIAKGTGESDNAGVDTNYLLGLHKSGADWIVGGDYEAAAGGANHLVTGTTLIQNDTWYHAALTYDGSELKVYLDGALEGTLATTDLPASVTGQPAALGAGLQSNGSARGVFQGLLDDARIYDSALSDAEILALATGTAPVGPVMGAPASSNPTDDGATVQCQLLQDDADDVTVVWAFADQGETTIGDWTGAAGGGSHSFGAASRDDVLSQALSGLDGDTQYSFRFLATKAPDSDWSALGLFTTGLGGSPAPADFAGTPGTGTVSTMVDLSWTDSYSTETGFVIRRSTDPGFATFDEFLAGANETTFTDVTTDPNTTYYYRIAPVGASGIGAFSADIEVMTGDGPDLSGDLSSGLVAYYPLNDGAGLTAAESVAANDGTLSGNFTGSEWTTGKLGGGLQFTRTLDVGPYPGTHAGFIEADELLKTVNPATGVLEDGVAYTFAAWVKWVPQAAGSVNYGYAIWGANTAVNQNGNVIRLGLDNDADGFTARAVNGLAVDPAGVVSDFTDQAWHLVTAVFDPGGNADLYFDGRLSVSRTSDTGNEREKLWSVANLFHFGMEMEADETTDPFSGTLDELAMWNRELTEAEIFLLYNGGDGVSLGATGPVLQIASSGDNLLFTWDSKFGKVYDLLSSMDLSTDPATWPEFDGNIPATPPTNSEMYVRPADPATFFVLVEKDGPPVFEENFDAVTAPALPADWSVAANTPPDTGTTAWELGDPAGGAVTGPSAANSGANCCGTNIAVDYGIDTDITLRSAAIDLSDANITGAKLTFQQFRDLETDFDFGRVRVLKSSDGTQLGADVATEITGTSGGWVEFSADLPAEAIGQSIRIEFQFASDEQVNQAGWYIDDVVVSVR